MITTHRPYRVDATQKEKAAILKNDERVRSGSTFLDHTHSEEGGRYAKPTNVIGSTPTPQYPAGPNWSVDPTGVEPPLVIDVNAVEPCGEKFEIEALDDVTTVFDGQSVASPLAAAVAPSSVCASPDVERAAANPNPKPKSRRGV
jgi:hypothetical protein